MSIFSVVKFDGIGDRNWVVYKFPGDSFNTRSKLIVGVGQVAIVIHGGKVENVFESGTYILNTENLPFIKGLVKKVHGGSAPYTMEVYFVNKTIKLDMLWGTKDPIQVIDPKFNIKIRMRSRGQFGIKITNYQFFLTTLIGTINFREFVTFGIIQDYFRGLINTKIKATLGEYIIKNNVSALDIALYIEEIADTCKSRLEEELNRFGLDIINFFIESINVPEEDLAIINGILNKRAEFEIMGDARYQTARGYDVLEKAAGNKGAAGSISAAGVGLGLGLGVAQSVGTIAKQGINVGNVAANICPKCGHEVGNAKFCPNCGNEIITLCPGCKKEIKPGTKFCPECGTKIE